MHNAADKVQKLFEIVEGRHVRARRLADEDDRKAKRARRFDLRIGRVSAAVLCDDDVDLFLSSSRSSSSKAKGPRARMI